MHSLHFRPTVSLDELGVVYNHPPRQ